ncbi:MAG: SRPBCC family protein [Aestuariivirgaceae bacterium]
MVKTALERKAEASIRDRTLIFVRRLPAEREKVFRAWTDQKLLAQWMAPGDMTIPSATVDAREGGGYRITMRAKEGKELTVSGQYCEVKPAERIVMTWAWEEEQGHGPVTCITIELKPSGKATEMRFHHALFEDKDTRNSHRSGWQSIFDKLARWCKASALN